MHACTQKLNQTTKELKCTHASCSSVVVLLLLSVSGDGVGSMHDGSARHHGVVGVVGVDFSGVAAGGCGVVGWGCDVVGGGCDGVVGD